MVLSNDSPPPVSWPPHFDKPAARCGASTQELFLFPSRCPRTESSRTPQNMSRALPKIAHIAEKHGPKTGPIFWAQNWARLTNWCKKLGPFSGLKIMPALSRFFAEAASHLSCLG